MKNAENNLKDDFITACGSLVPPNEDVENENESMQFIRKCVVEHPEWAAVGFESAVAGGVLKAAKFLSFYVGEREKKNALFEAVCYGNLDVAKWLEEDIRETMKEEDYKQIAECSLESFCEETINWAFGLAPYDELLARGIMSCAKKTHWTPESGAVPYVNVTTVFNYLKKAK